VLDSRELKLASAYEKSDLVAEVQVIENKEIYDGFKTAQLRILKVRRGDLGEGDEIDVQFSDGPCSGGRSRLTLGSKILYFGTRLTEFRWSAPSFCNPSRSMASFTEEDLRLLESLQAGETSFRDLYHTSRRRSALRSVLPPEAPPPLDPK